MFSSFGIPLIMSLKSPWNGLVAYWKMESNSNDSIASHNGTDVGTITYGTGSGKINSGMSITGTTSMITLSDLSEITGSTVFSAGGWIYSTATGQRYILSVDAVDYPNNYGGWTLLQLSSGKLQLAIGKNLHAGWVDAVDFEGVDTVNSISLNTWYHVIGTYDGLNIRIYLNGVLEATQSWVSGLGWDTVNYGRIGAERVVVFGTPYDPYNAFGQNPWQGYIDEIGIWNRALSDSEVAALYNGGSGRSYPFS